MSRDTQRRCSFLLGSLVGVLLFGGWITTAFSASGGKSTAGADEVFVSQVQPVLEKYCYTCHGNDRPKADLNLSRFAQPALVREEKEMFAEVLAKLRAGEMPPSRKPQPALAERELIIAWLQTELFPLECDHPDPGRVTIRRLNRAEYNNTIRDLVGIDFKPADDFPADDSGNGFDNIGDALSISPLLFERYLAAAEAILDQAVVIPAGEEKPRRFEAEELVKSQSGDFQPEWAVPLNRRGELSLPFEVPREGRYVIRVRAFGRNPDGAPPRLGLFVDAASVHTAEVRAEENQPAIYEQPVTLTAGRHTLAAGYVNNRLNHEDPGSRRSDRELFVDYLEVLGPIDRLELPETHRRIFVAEPQPGKEREAAREIISGFARRAFRRPVRDSEVTGLLSLFEMARLDKESFEGSVKVALEAVLVSPHFLFRGELQPEPNNPKSIHPIDEFALASRLSYFLWSSMPDEELFELAGKKQLRRNLKKQVERMLADPKSQALVDNFAGQWLQLRNVRLMTPDPALFPEFDGALQQSMRRETELFFDYILHEDHSVLEFLDADYTFVNRRLARHYGLPPVEGEGFQRVSLKGTRRGGLLTQASILTLTSNPTRTSPVKRGKWVLENLLGTPPPPPPPNVPELDTGEQAALTGTLRERMVQHRENPVCASCHERMDPIGFGLENFDAIGAWRDQDGPFDIDASGRLFTGEEFNGAAELQRIIEKQHEKQFIHCFTEKLLTYALGRGLQYYDECAIERISRGARRKGCRFSAFILGIVNSTPFQQRRGEDSSEMASN